MRQFVIWMAALPLAPAQEPVYTRITVTASRGAAEDAAQTAQHVAVRDRAAVLEKPAVTVGNALDAQPGILVQQSTAGQVSPFLRGLTGYQVLNLIDGVRFNNATFRSGPNQYLVFVEPSQARRVEAMLGPAGAQYGSDALGGAINIITAEPQLAGSGWRPHGELTWFGASADWSSGGNAQASLGNEKIWWLLGGSGRRHGDLRPGQGWDSRNVFYRLFGLEPDLVRALNGGRQQDSGFSQYGVNTKLALRPAADRTVTLWYQRGALNGVRGYKDLLGGLGRLRSTFDPQVLDFFYARVEKQKLAFLDTLSGTFSVNQQSDGGARQNLRLTDPVTTDWSRVRSLGYSALATAHAGSRVAAAFGADTFDEHVRATRLVNGAAARPLYPDRSRYTTYGVFGQASAELLPSRLRLAAGGRWTRVGYASLAFSDVTFHTSLSLQATRWLGLSFLAGRGFRAPNLNDLGALGLNDLGYEIPASEAAGALLGDSAGEGALSLGRPVAGLRAESLFNYETGFRFTARRFYGRVHFFDAELGDPIVRRTLLFPAAAVPSQLAGIAVTPIAPSAAQRAQGVVTVATALDPRAVKAFVNDGRSRYYGVESMMRYAFSAHWALEGNYTFLVGRDLDPNRSIRRLPPQMGALSLRYTAPRQRFWIEAAGAAAGAQRRLSGGDLDDERIGASRRRQDIADFFNGSRAAPLVDGAGRFTPTGETLFQIQQRVLPGVASDTVRVPLYRSTSGWVTTSLRGGIPLGERLTIHAALENALDRQYRVHGSGLDAAGRNAYLGLRYLW